MCREMFLPMTDELGTLLSPKALHGCTAIERLLTLYRVGSVRRDLEREVREVTCILQRSQQTVQW
jgi:hypothetical protein